MVLDIKYTIIIVNYNLTDEIENCVRSILLYLNKSDYELIILDNNSIDRSILKIVDKMKIMMGERFSFFQLDSNYGFGWACNYGSHKAKGEILFFLNPDTILTRDVLQDVYEVYSSKKDDVGVVGLRSSQNNIIDYSAGYFPNMAVEALNIVSIGRYCEAIFVGCIQRVYNRLNVHWIMGAAIFVKRELFISIGGFDEAFFLYFEEMDLCKRIYDLKRTNIYLPNISVNHIGSVSSKKNYYIFTKMFYKGKLLFINKHFHGVHKSILKNMVILHIYFQIFIWKYLNIKNIEKSNSKICAFRELLINIHTPSKISNS